MRPVGELDLATVPAWSRSWRGVRESGVPRVVLDLRGLTFMDSTGLSLTLRWSLEASRDGFDFSLVRGDGRDPPPVRADRHGPPAALPRRGRLAVGASRQTSEPVASAWSIRRAIPGGCSANDFSCRHR